MNENDEKEEVEEKQLITKLKCNANSEVIHIFAFFSFLLAIGLFSNMYNNTAQNSFSSVSLYVFF